MSYTVRRSNIPAVALPTTASEQKPKKGRKQSFKANVPLDKMVGFYGNDPDRTNRSLRDFQELVEAFKNGEGCRGPARAAYDEATDTYYTINGHRSIEASKDAGFTTIDVLVLYPGPGESAQQVQEELFPLDNKNRPYKGKACLRTAIISNGRTVMDLAKRAWGIIQKYGVSQVDLDWMAINAAPDLVKITESVITYVVLARMKEGEISSPQYQKALFVTAMGVLKRLEVQRETREYVTNPKNVLNATRALEKALEKGTVLACIFSEAQKNKVKKVTAAQKKAAKKVKALRYANAE